MIKLLLVEDDASLAYIEKTGLEDIIGGYKVTTASNGKRQGRTAGLAGDQPRCHYLRHRYACDERF